jgi:hypothetical protein
MAIIGTKYDQRILGVPGYPGTTHHPEDQSVGGPGTGDTKSWANVT